MLSLIDPALLKQDPNDVVIADRVMDEVDRKNSPSKQRSYLHSSSGSSGSGDVQVLFLFASDVTNQSSRAANIVSEMNFALQQSGVDQLALNKISEAGIKILATDFDGECRIPIILDMGNRNPPFSNLDSWLTSYDADIAFLVTSTDDSLQCAGSPPKTIGRIGGAAFLFDPTKPFGMTTDTYATGDLTAPHEIGHMLGGQHADFTVDSPVPTLPGGDGAHGRENDNAGSWQTIMGGHTTDRCVFDTGEFDPTRQPCERLNFFSNPGIGTFLNGTVVTLGTSADDGGVNDDDGQRKADMETWLEQTAMETVSGYHPDPSAPTGAPSLAVTSDSCFGQHNASWNSVSGAEYYQLFRSNDSNFSSPMLAADISGTLAFVNVPSNSTWYLRVRACNSGGCGSFSNQQTATWVNFCA